MKQEISRLIDRFERWTGLDLRRGSTYVALERYLRHQLPAGDPGALARYVDDLTTPHHPEAVRLVDAITVCHTSFYRDPEQLACIELVLRAEPSRMARVWVPACATGEDPYSIALLAERVGRPVSILGTDINTRALTHAAAGIYGPWSVRELPPDMVLPQRTDGRYEIPPRLRRQVSFSRHNLMDVVPGSADGWDIILCRNVLMYLGRERVREVLQRLAAALRPGGYLFIGANDVLERPPPLLRFVRMGQRHVLWRPPTLTPPQAVLQTPPMGVPIATLAPPGSSSAQMTAVSPPGSTSAQMAAVSPFGSPSTQMAAVSPSGSTSAQMAAVSPPSATGSWPPPTTPPVVARTTTPTAGLPLPSTRSLTPPVGVPLTGVPTQPTTSLGGGSPSPARAHALLHEGNTSGALDLVLELLDADPLNVEARLIAGMAYQLAGDAQQATEALRAALVLDPDLWPAEMYLGFALRQLGDETSAIRALRRGAELAATNERLPLSPSVATWFEGWRVDAIAMARHTKR